MSMANVLGMVDKANSFMHQPARVNNPKETAIDYEAVQEYFSSSEAIIDMEEKYFDADEE